MFNAEDWTAALGMTATGANAEAEAIMRTLRANENFMINYCIRID